MKHPPQQQQQQQEPARGKRSFSLFSNRRVLAFGAFFVCIFVAIFVEYETVSKAYNQFYNDGTNWIQQNVIEVVEQEPKKTGVMIRMDDPSLFTKTAIVTLTTNIPQDLLQLCRALDSLRNLNDANLTRVMIFHEGNLDVLQKEILKGCCTPRSLSFPIIDFQDYPTGFDPDKERSNFRQHPHRNVHKWGYQQMIRFFVTRLWDHDAMEDVEVYMRLDADSCWNAQTTMAPVLREDQVYVRNIGRLEFPLYCKGIYEWTQAYMVEHDITPTYPEGWESFGKLYNATHKCRMVYNNFEMARVSFMKQASVRQFHHALTEEAPFHVFKKRWGDAVLRFVLFLLFGPKSALDENPNGPVGYEHPCQSYDVPNMTIPVANSVVVEDEATVVAMARTYHSSLSSSSSSSDFAKTAIVTLVTNAPTDMQRLCRALDSLGHLRDNNATRVMIFHEGNLHRHHKTYLEGCTPRSLSYPIVDFQNYPDGFNPDTEQPPHFRQHSYRVNKWGYSQMIRFFLTRLWDHEAMKDVEVYMRLDNDSCWNNRTDFAPILPPGQVYIRNEGRLEAKRYSAGIVDWVQAYVEANNVTPTVPVAYEGVKWAFAKTGQCRMFYNNFEVASVPFMRQRSVRQFHHALTEEEPYNVFRRRWGDAVMRFIMLSLFAPESTFEGQTSGPVGYEHPCYSYDVPDYPEEEEEEETSEQEQQQDGPEAFAKTAIVTLTSNIPQDLLWLCRALDTLKNLKDNSYTRVIIFNEGDLDDVQKQMLQSCTPRALSFPVVAFDDFPEGFDPETEQPPKFRQHKHRIHKWGYSQMIRFFMTRLWDHEAMDDVEVYMRLDIDSCWTNTTTLVPKLAEDQVYIRNHGRDEFPLYCRGIYELTVEYMEKNAITPANPGLWADFERFYKKREMCRMVYNNFEIARVSFMRKPEVRKFHMALTEAEPFGVFRRRWGDAVLRYVMLVLFGPENALTYEPKGPVGYEHRCASIDVPNITFPVAVPPKREIPIPPPETFAKTAIVTLVTNFTVDLQRLCRGLTSLTHIKDGNATRVIVFHEGDLSERQMELLRDCTPRSLSFPIIDFQNFPEGFDPERETPAYFKQKSYRVNKWGYAQMIRFFLTRLWEHEAMDDVEVYMRLDNDACWNDVTEFAPVLEDGRVYIHNEGRLEVKRYSAGIVDWVQEYIKANNVTPVSANEWFGVQWAFNKTKQVRMFYNNFEVASVPFMRRPEVRKFHKSLTEQEPFNVFRRRWGDATLRFIMLSLFAPQSSFEGMYGPDGYEHPCTSYEEPDIAF